MSKPAFQQDNKQLTYLQRTGCIRNTQKICTSGDLRCIEANPLSFAGGTYVPCLCGVSNLTARLARLLCLLAPTRAWRWQAWQVTAQPAALPVQRFGFPPHFGRAISRMQWKKLEALCCE